MLPGGTGRTYRILDWLIRKEKLEVKRQLRYCSGFACKTVYFTPEMVSVDYSKADEYFLPAGDWHPLPLSPLRLVAGILITTQHSQADIFDWALKLCLDIPEQ